MMTLQEMSPLCAALAAALGDGRFLEDPAHWRGHVEACSTCREHVEGYFDLRSRIERVRMAAPANAQVLRDPAALVARAMARYRRRRLWRASLAGLGLSVLALGAGLLLRDGTGSSGHPIDDPVELAIALHAEVFPAGSPPRATLLRDDARARARHLEALSHPSALVRSTALTSLTFSRVELDPSRLEDVLGTWNEKLDAPLVVAAGGDQGRHVVQELERRRGETLQLALRGAGYQAARGQARVRPEVVLPFVRSPYPGVAHEAVLALAADPEYRPGADIVELFEQADTPADVRVVAAECLVARLGAEGVRHVTGWLERAPQASQVEASLVPDLLKRAEGRAWSRQRCGDPRIPVAVAIAHASGLSERGEQVAAAGLPERALATGSVVDAFALARLAAAQRWEHVRGPLQQAWSSNRTVWRQGQARLLSLLVRRLVAWDEAVGSPARLALALDLCADLGARDDDVLRAFVRRVRGLGDTDLAARAGVILGE